MIGKAGEKWFVSKALEQNWYHVAVSESGQFQTAVVFNGGIWVSNDFGYTWNEVLADSKGWYGVDVSASGEHQVACVYSTAGSTNGIWVSEDYGQNWIQSDAASRNWRGVAMSQDGSFQVAIVRSTAAGNGIWISNNYGVNWGRSPGMDVLPGNGNGGWHGVGISKDGKYQVAALDFQSAVLRGIWVSEDYGSTWAQSSAPENVLYHHAAISATGQHSIAASLGLNGIWISNDYGNIFEQKKSGISWDAVAISANGQHQTAVNGGIWYSNDYGDTWEQSDAPSDGWWSVDMSYDGSCQSAAIIGPSGGIWNSSTRVILRENDVYFVKKEDKKIKFEYIGEDQTYCTIILEDYPFSFKLFNDNGTIVWDYDTYNSKNIVEDEFLRAYALENSYIIKSDYHFIGSKLMFSISKEAKIDSESVIVAMASLQHGEGRVFIHTDRIGGVFTGHGPNPTSFWRKVLEWVSHKKPNHNINIGLLVNTIPHSANRLNSFNPTSLEKLYNYQLMQKDLSQYDCLYFVGIPEDINEQIPVKIAEYVESGGGLIIEYPNIEGKNINILKYIDRLYCYSDQRLNSSYAYWTEDGTNSDVFNDQIQIAFMSTLRIVDFSNRWNILKINIPYVLPPDDRETDFNFTRRDFSEFSITYTTAMQNGIVVLET